MLFDTHAHYNDSQFDEDIDELLSSMPENNVGLIIVPASKLSEMNLTGTSVLPFSVNGYTSIFVVST